MVDNKKVVKSVAAAALTGAFVAPATAQAAKVPEASNMAAIFGMTGASLMLRRRRRQKGGTKTA